MLTLIRPATFRNTGLETCFSYDRTDGKHVEFVIVHLPDAAGDGPQEPFLHLSTRKISKNPNCALNEQLVLSPAEGRMLRDFLNRPEVEAWLEESEEDE